MMQAATAIGKRHRSMLATQRRPVERAMLVASSWMRASALAAARQNFGPPQHLRAARQDSTAARLASPATLSYWTMAEARSDHLPLT